MILYRLKFRKLARLSVITLLLSVMFTFFINLSFLKADEPDSYEQLKKGFQDPDPARWGEVPLWWWEGAPLSKERITWQLETLAEKGVKSVCPIQRSPGRCDPKSFSPEWWDMLEYAHKECKRLGMSLWAYDQVGYGHYGWLEKAAAKIKDSPLKQIEFISREVDGNATITLDLPSGELLGAGAYEMEAGQAGVPTVHDLTSMVDDGMLKWEVPSGRWKIAISVASPFKGFYLQEAATDTFLNMLYGEIEQRVGNESMGSSFAGVFQDEHPPTPRDLYTEELGELFRERNGYEIGKAIPALHFDVGKKTPKYRLDFYDTYLELVEQTYWQRVFDWTEDRGILFSHDNWGRNNIYRQSQGYIDYFRTQRWFSAPGFDDSGLRPITERNYYDIKIAASIARLYDRSRVWDEAFHSSGWGRTTEQTMDWLTANYAFGANLYDEHGLYYSTNASTWEHAAPDPHWRQPYWRYYNHLSEWVSRMSYLMSQGNHVVDVAVHYPVVSLLAETTPGESAPDYNTYMDLSRTIYDEGMDNDIIDDHSILRGDIQNGTLKVGENNYQALVFGPEETVRRSVIEKSLKMAESGGTVIFYGQLPTHSPESGRDDPALASLLSRLFGSSPERLSQTRLTVHQFDSGGEAVFLPAVAEKIPALLTTHISRDVITSGGDVFMAHRRVGETDIYLFQNTQQEAMTLQARLRADAVPERWDPLTGNTKPVDAFHRKDGYTHITQNIRGNTAKLVVLRPGNLQEGRNPSAFARGEKKSLSEDWEFSVIPTRDNQWGEFRWPPSEDKIGPEIRQLRYREEGSTPGTKQGWHRPGFNDKHWSETIYSMGPQWLSLTSVPEKAAIISKVRDETEKIATGEKVSLPGQSLEWEEVTFSKTIGRGRPVGWRGHSGYPDGHMDKDFIDLPEGRKILFTRIRSPKQQRVGLHIALRNSQPKLWVNGEQQPVEGAVGNLPLQKGVNTVLLDVPDGGRGMLYVQDTPPSATSLEEAKEGVVMPDFTDAHWIWHGNTDASYFRKTFTLDQRPQEARLAITAYTGYQLFINGEKIEEEIGPWAHWDQPELFNVTSHLREGRNTIAIWGQFYAGQHHQSGIPAGNRAVAMAIKYRTPEGTEETLVTDNNWKATTEEYDGWQEVQFDAGEWQPVTVKGQMGDEPWGDGLLANLRTVTTPQRPLSVNLSSPYLQVFKEGPQVVYDIKPLDAERVGWYRFEAPPGLSKVDLHTNVRARAWVNGREVPVRNGVIRISEPPVKVSTVALRLEMDQGEYAGAAFSKPPSLTLEKGLIQTGKWADYALPTYSGIGVYSQKVEFTLEEAEKQIELDLGEVLVAAKVLVNGESAGVKLASPYTYDLTGLIQPGENTIEIRVANTIAPHYKIPRKTIHLGPTDSGLIGPVELTLMNNRKRNHYLSN